ncbi:MAG: hemolysin family protein [Bacillota bacterium]
MDINWTGIYLIGGLVLLNAFFAASEIAVITSRRVKIKQLEENGNKSAAALIKLIDDPSLFLATIQVGITLAGLLASATAAVGLSEALAGWFEAIGVPGGISNSVGVFTVTLIVAYITLVFGELAPKRLAMQWSEKIALVVARPIILIARATTPLTKFLTLSTNLVVRLLGGNVQLKEKELSEDEIRFYIAEHRTLPEEEKLMIEAVFDFGDQVVRQVMVPRTEIFHVNGHDRIVDALHKVCDKNYSAYPVYENDYENIVGMVRIQDLACNLLKSPDLLVEKIMSPTLFIPETKHTVALLKEFRQKKIGMAIIVDEYGGISGLITLEDLVDEIIGDLTLDQNLIRKTSEGEYLVEGDTPIEDIIDILNLKRLVPDAEYETIAGFILEQLGHLPMEGETVLWEGYKFQVQEMGTRRIEKVLISSASKEQASN